MPYERPWAVTVMMDHVVGPDTDGPLHTSKEAPCLSIKEPFIILSLWMGPAIAAMRCVVSASKSPSLCFRGGRVQQSQPKDRFSYIACPSLARMQSL